MPYATAMQSIPATISAGANESYTKSRENPSIVFPMAFPLAAAPPFESESSLSDDMPASVAGSGPGFPSTRFRILVYQFPGKEI